MWPAVAVSEEVRRRLARPASVATVGGFRPPDDPAASWLGCVKVLGADEAWPALDGEPLPGLCQINLGELPWAPPALDGAAFLSLFALDEACVVRTYASADGLVPVEPVLPADVRPFPMRWRLVDDDLPAYEDASDHLSPEERDAYDGYPAEGVKVGGWPTLVQAALHEIDYVFQLDSDYKTGLVFGDQGVLYVGRSRQTGEWAVEEQSL